MVRKSFNAVVRQTRDANYNYYGRDMLLYPPTDGELPIYLVSGIYLAVPLEFSQLDTRLVGGQNHVSIRMDEVANFVRFEGWTILLLNLQEEAMYGVIDSVFIDDTQGVLNLKYNIVESDTSRPSKPQGVYLR
ncbi:hypothetical protein PVA44_07570 (plasmid) [Entomospira nematocerorum]|uniref:Uncharacterized protein n=1 Tax=Entomospira nematocerorum TaxID=2719987 RepID=A0A968GGE3_9SPIO|nr:hypothetical protein [Entomospira nematocera]NIZ47770.1 hypothetical protein [Entomospira nematocera]WDI34724.1 hypothetical protein PVA44_07570 [Entomospira nematocera]